MTSTNSLREDSKVANRPCTVCGKSENVRTGEIEIADEWIGSYQFWYLCSGCHEAGWEPVNAGMLLVYLNQTSRQGKYPDGKDIDGKFHELFGL